MYEKAKLQLMLIGATSRGDPCTQYFWVMRLPARRCRAALALISACLLAAGCAPTFDSHIDSPPASILPPTPVERPKTIALAPLDPRPQLPDANQSPCPPGSGLAACFTMEQNAIRQQRFKILHDDRDYCRDAYDRAVKRAAGN
jgi:hypothetical protein